MGKEEDPRTEPRIKGHAQLAKQNREQGMSRRESGMKAFRQMVEDKYRKENG